MSDRIADCFWSLLGWSGLLALAWVAMNLEPCVEMLRYAGCR